MASPAVRRRRLLLVGFVGILVIAWAMNAIGGPEPQKGASTHPTTSPSVSVAPLPPSAVPLTADGFTFSPDACLAFPPTTSGPAKATVFLDAGHGGVDPGTGGRTSRGKRIQEKAATLAIVKVATEQVRAAGYRVVVSRWVDTTVGVPRPGDLVNGVFNADGARQDVLARVACANASGASALISVHMNAFGLPSEGGALTIWDPDRTFRRANERLAGFLQRSVISQLHAAGWPVPDRGTLRDTRNHGTALTVAGARYGHEALIGPYSRGWVSHPSHMPGAIIEPLFLTRPTEADIAYSAPGQAALARAIVAAVEQFLSL
jgi:N-acetylmuramoyl-L-alanine amidase